jgi:tetratricopeptide (TPR) repeat protein/tRNA A-37 threonylcarbamoyl transferase component Bud32
MIATAQNMQHCPRCGQIVRAEARFCSACGTPLSRAVAEGPLAPGARLGHGGRYRIERRLGRGGFGAAYLARDTHLGRDCVVKRLLRHPSWDDANWERARRLFAREAQLLVALNSPGHPNIPEIYEFLAESHCLVMKYVEGQPLDDLLDRRAGPLPLEEALRYARDVAAALAYMHSRDPELVLHRDVKPANILRDVAGRIFLVDFGLARATLPASIPVAADGASLLAGTLGFSPPEQWQGRAEPRSDVYALAATLHLMLSNYRPPHAEVLALMQGVADLLPALRALNPNVPPSIERLVRQALMPDPQARPGSRAFLAELEAALSGLAVPPPPAPQHPPLVPGLIGREAELAELADRLATRGAVIVVGPAGVGKTTLLAALSRGVAETHGPRLPTSAHVDPGLRVFWHTLQEGESSDRLQQALAGFLATHGLDLPWRLLHHAAQAGSSPASDLLAGYLADALRGQHFLLCLDDMHLLEGDAAFARLVVPLRELAERGELQLIGSARQVPSWARPGDTVALGGLDAASAAALLASQGLALASDLAGLLHSRTEGNAKFLVLAASALQRGDDPRRLADALAATDDVAGYLLDQVHRRLSPLERDVMSAVSLLGGPATRDTVEYLLDADGLWEVLAGLARQFLLNITPGPEGSAYAQHAMLRDFYYQRLGLRRRLALHRRAAGWFERYARDPLVAARHYALANQPARAAALATADVPSLINRGQARALERLLAELPVEQFAPPLRATTLTARAEAATLLGEFGLARDLLREALGQGAQAPVDPECAEHQARRHRLLALVGERIGGYREAEDHCRSGLALVGELPPASLEPARLHAQLADLLWRQSRLDEAERSCADGLRTLPPAPAARERALLLHRRATVNGRRGNYAVAITTLEHSLELARDVQDYQLVAAILNALGDYLDNAGQDERALECYAESLHIREQIGDVAGRVYPLMNQGVVLMNRGDYHAALALFVEVQSTCDRLRMPQMLAHATVNIGIAYQQRGRHSAATHNFEHALAIFRGLSNRIEMADCLYRLGEVALAEQHPEAARRYGVEALDLAQAADSAAYESCALRVVGEALLAQGQIADAQATLARAWELQRQVGDHHDLVQIYAALARLALAQGDGARAREQTEAGLALARKHGLLFLVTALEDFMGRVEGEFTPSTTEVPLCWPQR